MGSPLYRTPTIEVLIHQVSCLRVKWQDNLNMFLEALYRWMISATFNRLPLKHDLLCRSTEIVIRPMSRWIAKLIFLADDVKSKEPLEVIVHKNLGHQTLMSLQDSFQSEDEINCKSNAMVPQGHQNVAYCKISRTFTCNSSQEVLRSNKKASTNNSRSTFHQVVS